MGMMQKTDILLKAGDVLDRYGISERTLARWCKGETFPKAIMINGKRYFKKSELDAFDEAQAGRDLSQPETALGLAVVSGVIQSYEEFVSAMKARRLDLKLSSMETEAKSGLQEGYIPKLENPGKKYGRGVGPDTMPLWLGGLRVGIVLVDLPRRPRIKKQDAKAAEA